MENFISTKKVIISVKDAYKNFLIGKEHYPALRGITVDIYEHDFTVICGPSGSGKSTFLNCILGLEIITNGNVTICDKNISNMPEDERATLRSEKFGVVYQQPIWIKSLNVIDNVAMPLIIRGYKEKDAYKKAEEALEKTGMMMYKKHKPTEVSGGQQQRISLARAISNDPEILILDEPTGNLDTHAADEVMTMLQKLKIVDKRTIIMVTHNLMYLPYADEAIYILDGQVTDIRTNKKGLITDIGGMR